MKYLQIWVLAITVKMHLTAKKMSVTEIWRTNQKNFLAKIFVIKFKEKPQNLKLIPSAVKAQPQKNQQGGHNVPPPGQLGLTLSKPRFFETFGAGGREATGAPYLISVRLN